MIALVLFALIVLAPLYFCRDFLITDAKVEASLLIIKEAGRYIRNNECDVWQINTINEIEESFLKEIRSRSYLSKLLNLNCWTLNDFYPNLQERLWERLTNETNSRSVK